LRKKGTLQVSLLAKNKAAGSLVQISIPGKKAQITIPKSDKYVSLKIGNTIIKDSGFYEITLEDIRQGGQSVADIQGIELSGTAVPGMHFNTKPRRNAASVHLRYPLPDSAKAVAFYNEITIPVGVFRLSAPPKEG
ncbi:MAG: DUF5077 domain-containing protein, partial [Bacteroidetes bacterium]|nr:DUF5077 domain-containing protein [Bacteroidota bacterium]